MATKYFNLDTDPTLSSNSDYYIPSQKAIKTALDTKQDKLVAGDNIYISEEGVISASGGGNGTGRDGLGWDLFDSKFVDHILDSEYWVRADLFEWLDSALYIDAYNELVSEFNSTSEVLTDGDITYKKSAKGYNICLQDQETAIQTRFNDSGVAWFYILDPDTQKFKLPRTQWNFVGLRDNVGGYVAESLPNITGTYQPYTGNNVVSGFADGSVTNGAFYGVSLGNIKTSATSGNNNPSESLGFDASLSSSTYQDGAPVQQRATQMYLYFCVKRVNDTPTNIDPSQIVNDEITSKTTTYSSAYLTENFTTKNEVTTLEENIDAKLDEKLTAGNIYAGVNINIVKNGNDIIISSTGGGSDNTPNPDDGSTLAPTDLSNYYTKNEADSVFAAKASEHTHANKTLLDNFTCDASGVLRWNGNIVPINPVQIDREITDTYDEMTDVYDINSICNEESYKALINAYLIVTNNASLTPDLEEGEIDPNTAEVLIYNNTTMLDTLQILPLSTQVYQLPPLKYIKIKGKGNIKAELSLIGYSY